MIKSSIVSTLLILASYQLTAQDDNLDKELYSQDTVFVLINEEVKAITFGKQKIETTKEYPEDKNRYYFFDDDPVSFNNIYFTKIDLELPFYFIESKERFHRREYIKSSDLANKPVSSVLGILNNKVLMMVDPAFADSSNYYIVRVFRYAGEE